MDTAWLRCYFEEEDTSLKGTLSCCHDYQHPIRKEILNYGPGLDTYRELKYMHVACSYISHKGTLSCYPQATSHKHHTSAFLPSSYNYVDLEITLTQFLIHL